MSIGSIGHSSSPLPLSALAGSINPSNDSGGDGDHRARVHGHSGHHHGGGGMRSALTQALQSLGLTVPQSANSATAAGNVTAQSPADAGGDGDADDGGGASGTAALKRDMHAFMHQLFEALRSESGQSGTSTDSGSTTSGVGGNASNPGFAGGFAALVADVGNGSAPSGLQQAFDALMSDLQQSGLGGSGGNATAGTTAGVTLQQLLTAMQQDLGYARSAAGSPSSTGNSVSVAA